MMIMMMMMMMMMTTTSDNDHHEYAKGLLEMIATGMIMKTMTDE